MKPVILFFILFLPAVCVAQEKGYALVSAINNNILMLDNCIDSSGSFKVNQKVVIIQKESPAQVVNNNSNKTVATRQVAKKYLVLTITDVERNDNLVTAIKVSRDLQHSFIINNSAIVDVHIMPCKWNW